MDGNQRIDGSAASPSPSGQQPTPFGTATTATGPAELSASVRQFFESRGISDKATAGRVHSETQNGADIIVFPYRENGQVVDRKYRGRGKKFWRDKGGKSVLWNIDAITASNPDTVYIVEGEMDALALIEADIPNVVSVPSGASGGGEELPDPEDDKAFAYLWNARETLDGKRFVIGVDDDDAGHHLREELVRRLGRGNCHILDWRGHKDANELLLKFGPEFLRRHCLEAFKPYPIKGLSRWEDVPKKPPVQSYGIGIEALNNMVCLAPGTLSVVTGIPNHGKSTLAKNIVVNMARNHGWRILLCSFEDDIDRNLKPELVGMAGGDEAFLARHVVFGFDEGVMDDAPMDIPWVIELIRDAKRRHGIDMVLIDPWNELEHAWGRDITETQYIGAALKELRRAAVERGVHVMVVAHPNKLDSGQRPGLYNISGSANWANKVDYGIVVHQPNFEEQDGKTEVAVQKIKRKAFGRRGTVELEFVEQSGTFREWDTYMENLEKARG